MGDTSQGGHWHGDEWHAEPHQPLGQAPGVEQIGIEKTEEPKTPAPVAEDRTIDEAYETARAKAKAEGKYATMTDVVADQLPSDEELRAMSDEELAKLYTKSWETALALRPEMKKRGDEYANFNTELFHDAKTSKERERIYKENRDRIDLLRKAYEAIAYEFYVPWITYSRVMVEQQERSPSSTYHHVDPETMREVSKMVEETNLFDVYQKIEANILEGGKE